MSCGVHDGRKPGCVPCEVASLTPDVREEWSERAGILEFSAGLDRAEAERVALVMVRQRMGRERPIPA